MDDLINRQQAIDAIEELMTRYFDRKVILAKAQDAVNNVPSVQPEQKWTPCSLVNQCFIPELVDVGCSGMLFTYITPKGQRRVKEAWIDRGRIIGKEMNGVPIAYMPLPKPYQKEGGK